MIKLGGVMVRVGGGITLSSACALLKPVRLAVIVVLPTESVVAGTIAVVWPSAIATVAGTLATPGTLDTKLIICPPLWAGYGNVSVRSCVWPRTTVAVPGARVRLGVATATITSADTTYSVGVMWSG